MEGHRSRRAGLTAALGVVLAVAVAVAAPLGAAEDAVGGTVDPSGVTITIVRWQGSDRVHATAAGGGDDPTGCDWSVIPAPVGVLPPLDIGPHRPDSYLGLLLCNGVAVEVIWVGPHNTVDLEVEARRLVESYVARVPVPQLALHANPAPGLVGIESWFWATGWDGAPIVDRIDALGVGVDVRIDPTPVRWDLGDGTVVEGGLGRPYPQPSPVAHGFIHHGTRPLRLAVDLVPRYRIDGTDWIELGPIEVREQRSYRVREAQAVVTG